MHVVTFRNSSRVGEVCGEDPLDALLNCINFVQLLLEKHKDLGYEVWWYKEGDNAGLTPASK